MNLTFIFFVLHFGYLSAHFAVICSCAGRLRWLSLLLLFLQLAVLVAGAKIYGVLLVQSLSVCVSFSAHYFSLPCRAMIAIIIKRELLHTYCSALPCQCAAKKCVPPARPGTLLLPCHTVKWTKSCRRERLLIRTLAYEHTTAPAFEH